MENIVDNNSQNSQNKNTGCITYDNSLDSRFLKHMNIIPYNLFRLWSLLHNHHTRMLTKYFLDQFFLLPFLLLKVCQNILFDLIWIKDQNSFFTLNIIIFFCFFNFEGRLIQLLSELLDLLIKSIKIFIKVLFLIKFPQLLVFLFDLLRDALNFFRFVQESALHHLILFIEESFKKLFEFFF